jgi:O-antigen/teichoic acid export membrane protein
MSLTIKYFLALAIPAVFGLTVLSKPILIVLSTPSIAEQSYLVTPFVAIGMLFMGLASVISNVIYLVKKTSVSMKISCMAAFIKLFFVIALVQTAGISGAAMATFLTLMFIFLANRHFALYFIRIRLDYTFIFKSILASSVMSTLIFFWLPDGFIEILEYVLVSMLIYFCIILLMKGIDKDDAKFIRSLFYA